MKTMVWFRFVVVAIWSLVGALAGLLIAVSAHSDARVVGLSAVMGMAVVWCIVIARTDLGSKTLAVTDPAFVSVSPNLVSFLPPVPVRQEPDSVAPTAQSEVLPPDQAREWLDEFLVTQQDTQTRDTTN